MSEPRKLGGDLWLQRHPFSLMGCRMGRNVTVMRLSTGKLIVHSTAAFSEEDGKAIRELGEPGWLVEATSFHDTFAAKGTKAFPDVPYLAPPGFSGRGDVEIRPILPKPAAWEGEVEVIELGGMPKIREHVFFHRASKTLVVADLIFNLSPDAGRWTRGFLRSVSGLKEYPGVSRIFRLGIKDRAAFLASLREIAAWDFERIVVGHGEPIETDAKAVFREVMERGGFGL